MNRLFYLILALTLLLTGCGKRMTGVYEATPQIPKMDFTGMDVKTRKAMEVQFKQIEDMNRMTLEFDGAKVKMGNSSSISEYKYRVKGNKLEVIVEAMGQKSILPMMIQADGSISYQTLRFNKKNR